MKSSTEKASKNYGIILAIGCLLSLACLVLFIITAAGFLIIERSLMPDSLAESASEFDGQSNTPWPGLNPAPTLLPTPDLDQLPSSTPDPEPISSPMPSNLVTPDVIAETTIGAPEIEKDLLTAQQPLNTLYEVVVPARDYYESARRLGSTALGSRTVPAESYSLGDRRTFRTDEGRLEAELLVISEHAYFWVETGLNIERQQINIAAEKFERDYYPVVVELFGNEWRPGVDNDPRFSILHLGSYADDSELGFFNSGDEYPRSVYSDSNENEMIYLNMANLMIGDPIYYGTLIHEFQHLIQWHHDPNEPIWFSEGLAQFTELYAGLDTVDSVIDYLAYPSIRLNSWEFEDEDALFAHYGAAYLFTVYIWEQLGEQALVEMVRHPADGLAALYHILPQFAPGMTIEQFLADWMVANYLDLEEAGSRFGYHALDLAKPVHAKTISRSPSSTDEAIDPFSVHYIDLEMTGETAISFTGDPTVNLFPELPYDGSEAWYVPGVNEADARLTASFELTNADDVNLNFWTWYDLEEDYDFAYLSISIDGGESWDFLVPDQAAAGTFGPAFSGRSQDKVNQVSGWINESVSLWRYTGQEVLIRFEVLTDSAITGGGFAVGDIWVSQNDEGLEPVWLAEGFVRTGSNVAHTWSLQLIQESSNPQIVPLQLENNSQGQFLVDLGAEGGVLVVSALTPYVGQPASYQLLIEPNPD